MSTVNNSLVASNSLYTDPSALNQTKGGQDHESLTYVLTPAEAGARRDASGKLPLTIHISEEAAERALFKKFGFNVDSATDLSKLKTLLKAGGESPFEKVKTEGAMVAYLNQKTGKYEIRASVEKSLYRELQGKAAEVKSQIEKPISPANPNETIAARNNSNVNPNNQANGVNGVESVLPNGASPNINGSVWMPVEGGATNDRTLLYHIQKTYKETNLKGDNYNHIFSSAKESGVLVKIKDIQRVGNQYHVFFEMKRTDAAKIHNLYKKEQAEVNQQIDQMQKAADKTVAESFMRGFFKGGEQVKPYLPQLYRDEVIKLGLNEAKPILSSNGRAIDQTVIKEARERVADLVRQNKPVELEQYLDEINNQYGRELVNELKQTREQFVDGLYETSRRDIDVHDLLGGHIREKHVGRSENWLQNRLKTDPDLADVDFASSFKNEETANRTLGKFVKEHKADIESFLKNPDKIRLEVVFDAGESAGIGVTRGKGGQWESNNVYAMIIKDKSENGWHIQTAYPTLAKEVIR